MDIKIHVLFLLHSYFSLHSCKESLYDVESNKRIQEWIKTEDEFRNLNDELKSGLNDKWEDFRTLMNKKMLQHHFGSDNNCLHLVDECLGKGSLTESEFLLHQALDEFSQKINNDEQLRRFHSSVHTVFDKTRLLLENLSLIQNSEYYEPVISKQIDMNMLYS